MNRNEPWTGDHTDLYAADFAALVAELDLCDAIRVGHSTGGGAVARPRWPSRHVIRGSTGLH
jgi:pimeloyl-ACP methyl ester carboxylesterase